MTDMAANILDDQGATLVELARLLRPSATPASAPPSRRRRRLTTVSVFRSDADKAGGAEVVRRTIAAVASPDDPALKAKAADVVAALAAIKPVTPVEGGLAGLFVAMERAAFDCLAIARIAGFDSLMGMMQLGRAEKLTCRATELAEALARQRCRGQQTIRIERITVKKGANALIGAVAGGGRK
jgi:hypothetical protein